MDEIKIIPGMNGKVSKRPIQGKKNGLSKKSFEETLNSNILQSKTPQKNKKVPEKKSSEIRHDLVRKFKLDLTKGLYDVRSKEIADKIIQKIRDEKSNFNI